MVGTGAGEEAIVAVGRTTSSKNLTTASGSTKPEANVTFGWSSEQGGKISPIYRKQHYRDDGLVAPHKAFKEHSPCISTCQTA